jgi:hypothetical protein
MFRAEYLQIKPRATAVVFTNRYASVTVCEVFLGRDQLRTSLEGAVFDFKKDLCGRRSFFMPSQNLPEQQQQENLPVF